MLVQDVLVQIPLGDSPAENSEQSKNKLLGIPGNFEGYLPIIALRAFVRSFLYVAIAEMLGERGWRWARHIAHRAFDAINVSVHVVVEQLFGCIALEAFAALEVVCKQRIKFE